MSKFYPTPRTPLFKATMYAVMLCSSASAETPGADTFCTELTVLVAQARTNFRDSAAATSALITPRPLPDAQNCMMARSLSGANAFHCAWKFPYRDAAAKAAFETLNQDTQTCLKGSVETVEDQGVNHPDSYQQHKHSLVDVVVSVSIKDKSALQETYVFVRVQGVVPD